MEIGGYIQSTMAKAEELDYQKEGDYLGEDGLLYCGKCKTKKQTMIPYEGENKIFHCMCKCKAKEVEEKDERLRKEEELIRIRRLRLSSLMDSKFYECKFERFEINNDNRRVYNVAMNYVKNFDELRKNNQGLLFYGDCGTGKSFTAACIANELLEQEISVIMTSFVKILKDLDAKDVNKSRYIENLNNATLLIVDDLGTERNTDYAIEQVYDVIDSRYRAKKPLILTTNLTLAMMQECDDIRYKRIYDRIFEMCFPVYFSGTSWRYKEAGDRFDEMKKLLEG